MMDPAGGEHVGERRDRLGALALPIEQVARDVHAVLGRPLPEFDRVQVEPLADAVRGQAAFLDPAVDGVLVHAEGAGRLPYSQLHAAIRKRRGNAVLGRGVVVAGREARDDAPIATDTRDT